MGRISLNISKPKVSTRSKRELSYEYKKKIINTYQKQKKINAKFTQGMLSEYYKEELGYLLPTSTTSEILKNQASIMATHEMVDYRTRTAQYPELEDCLYLYYRQLRDKDINVSEKILTAKAKVFATYYNIKNFSFSSGWISNFKRR